MNSSPTKYDALIRKIKRKRRLTVILFVLAAILLLLFAVPIHLVIAGETVIDLAGLPLLVTVLLAIVLFFAFLIAYAVASLPLYTALEQECDPEKYLALHFQLSKPQQLDAVCAVGYLYLGNDQLALGYAQKMIAKPRIDFQLVGLFNKARCEFMLGDPTALQQDTAAFSALLRTAKLKEKHRISYQRMEQVLYWLCALATGDLQGSAQYAAQVTSWNANSKMIEGFLHYLKGITAYQHNERDEAIYHFKTVQAEYSKTVFAIRAGKFLELLNQGAP